MQSQVTETACGVTIGVWEGVLGFPDEEKKGVSYLSTIPSTPATRPGPAMASHCAMVKLPQSQGMRLSISSKFEVVGHMPKATTGTLAAS